MNKKIFIVSAYPSTPNKVKILKECLQSLRKPDYDILLTTNYRITDNEIYDLVDYMIYDKTDIKSFVDYGIDFLQDGWWLDVGHFKITSMYNNAYHYDLFRSTYNAIGMVNSIGYDYFVYVEGDCILKDINKLNSILDEMVLKEKKMFFGKIEMIQGNIKYYDYSTLMYGGVPSFYLNNANIPYNVEDWVIKPFNDEYYYYMIGLEIIIYQKFQKHISDILELDFFEKMNDILEYNKIKKSTECGLKNIFYHDINKPESFYMVLYNDGELDEITINVYIDEILFTSFSLNKNSWWWNEIEINDIINKKIRIEMTIQKETDNTIVEMTPETINRIKKTQKYFFIQ
jgi:hypothetical protein